MSDSAERPSPVEPVQAVRDASWPRHDAVALWRAAERSDVDDIHRLRRAMDELDHPERPTGRDGLASVFDDAWIDPQRDSLLGFTPDGLLIAQGEVELHPSQDVRAQSTLLGGVHPAWRGRGIGRVLLAWQRRRSREQLLGAAGSIPRWSLAYVDERNPRAARLFLRAGFAIARYFTGMERNTAMPIDDVPTPAGVRVIGYEPAYAERTRLARNDSFRDHWGSLETVEGAWRRFVGGSRFRDELSVVAVDDEDQVAGFALTQADQDSWAARGFTGGYIALLGVIRSWRGRGLAPALLNAALLAQRTAGLERATLKVDVESQTGALGLYERIGFTATTREIAFIREY